jgi:hypothetical protein
MQGAPLEELWADRFGQRPSKESAPMNPTPAKPSVPSAPPPPAPRPGHCVACGAYHGSVGFELNCLRSALQEARAALRAQSSATAPAK